MKNKNNLWELNKKINFNHLAKQSFDIHKFRNIGGFNSKLSTWDPLEPSSRYFKSLLFEFASYLDNKIINHSDLKLNNLTKGSGIEYFIKRIKKRNIGQPITINYYNNLIDIDYLLSIEEMLFLNSELSEDSIILEIGPGFGRLAHSILSNYSNIEKYYLIDLPWMIDISKKFFKKSIK